METLFSRLTQNRMTYGDPKPSNFLLTPQNQPLLIDLDSIRQHRCGRILRFCEKKMRRRFKERVSGPESAERFLPHIRMQML